MKTQFSVLKNSTVEVDLTKHSECKAMSDLMMTDKICTTIDAIVLLSTLRRSTSSCSISSPPTVSSPRRRGSSRQAWLSYHDGGEDSGDGDSGTG